MIEIIFKFLFGVSAGEELYSAFLLQLADSPVIMQMVVCVSVVFALMLVICFYQFIRSLIKGRR